MTTATQSLEETIYIFRKFCRVFNDSIKKLTSDLNELIALPTEIKKQLDKNNPRYKIINNAIDNLSESSTSFA